MAMAHNLGFPRIGAHREMKQAVEGYWKGSIDQKTLQETGRAIRQANWQMQQTLDRVPVGDFSWYDHVLDMSAMLGVIPPRFQTGQKEVDLDTYFHMARGRAPGKVDACACEMTKWFDANYHYIVPEFHKGQEFRLMSQKLFDEVAEALKLGYKAKPVLLGPVSYLWQGKTKESEFNKLDLLPKLVEVYKQILARLKDQGVDWVQIDEPILVLDLPEAWKKAFSQTYAQLQVPGIKLLLTTYFGDLDDNLELAFSLPVAGVHVDAVRAPQQVAKAIKALKKEMVLSVGIVDGRNIWRTDLKKAYAFLKPISDALGDRLWVAGSCSLLHSPVDLDNEKEFDAEFRSWLSFAKQKVSEIALLSKALKQGPATCEKEFAESEKAVQVRRTSPRIHNPEVKKRLQSVTDAMMKRPLPYAERYKAQRSKLNLPAFPTTTIGSFPQTPEIRKARHDLKASLISETQYKQSMQEQITYAIRQQEKLGIDVLVHGEAERNDMVEYFGELLNGYAFSQNGWVQSYGSRCVKPPIIYGDVHRPQPMTLEWIRYAQSLTNKPVKGMLTGPVTMLCWSFVRDDQPRFETAKQIALALRDEVSDLEKAGTHVIQIDEPAFREGMPLRHKDRQEYFRQAVLSFKLSSSCVENQTQIHTHMCYSDFNDIIDSIADLDADVITIETSRSDMQLLKAFETYNYPNEIGPGVYDIHSPRIPSIDEMVLLIEKAAHYIPVDRLWVNPDCGLKTRGWPETEACLQNMMAAAKILRTKFSPK